MRAHTTLLAVLLASCASANEATPSPPEPLEPPVARVALLSARVPRLRFDDGFAPCADRARTVRFRFAARALLRYDDARDAWEPVHVSTDPREVVCGASPPAAAMLGLRALEPDRTYVAVLDVDGQTELHWVVASDHVCAPWYGTRTPPDGSLFGCVALAGGVQRRLVRDPRPDACGAVRCAVESVEPRSYVGSPPSLFVDTSLRPQLQLRSGSAYHGDPPHELVPVALARLTPEPYAWVRVPVNATARRVETESVVDLSDWLGIEFARDDNYALRVAMDGELFDVHIMVAGGACEDIMLAPPTPPGMQPGCIAARGGALATYLPRPQPILDARP